MKQKPSNTNEKYQLASKRHKTQNKRTSKQKDRQINK